MPTASTIVNMTVKAPPALFVSSEMKDRLRIMWGEWSCVREPGARKKPRSRRRNPSI